jgi:hypothetical protein
MLAVITALLLAMYWSWGGETDSLSQATYRSFQNHGMHEKTGGRIVYNIEGNPALDFLPRSSPTVNK